MIGKLFVVATPIGNLKDISQRAISILEEVDIIAAEDTRTSGKLLKHYEINTKVTSYHEHNESGKAEVLCRYLMDGKDIALISDAGTPCISDPGYTLINLARSNGVSIFTIPGPSSVMAALSVSGLPTEQFFYTGFLPRKKGRKTRFEFLAELPSSIVIFESPYRIIKTLTDIEKYMGNRVISVCRELTKIYEEVRMGWLSDIKEYFTETKPKGEFVIIVAKKDYKI